MSFSFLFNVLSLTFTMIFGWIRIAADIGLDGITSIAQIVSSLLAP